MKKILFVAMLMASATASAQCTTQTYVIEGKIITCFVCPQVTTCN